MNAALCYDDEVKPMRMLIADDERVIQFALRNYFSQYGFQIDTASEFEEAQALLATRTYNAVIADLRLTGPHTEEGLEIIRLARQRSADVCIVLLTAHRGPDVDTRADRLGADALLQKPTPLPDLGEQVFQVLGRGGRV